MTVREYLQNLNHIVKEHPELLDTIAIYAGDQEGNTHFTVYYTPTLGIFNDDGFKDELGDDEKANALCIN